MPSEIPGSLSGGVFAHIKIRFESYAKDGIEGNDNAISTSQRPPRLKTTRKVVMKGLKMEPIWRIINIENYKYGE